MAPSTAGAATSDPATSGIVKRPVLRTITLPAGQPGAGRTAQVQLLPGTKARPLLVMLTGYGESVADFQTQTGALTYGVQKGIVVAFPIPLPSPDGPTAWNAGTCCGHSTRFDKVFITRVVSLVEAVTPIARNRVYVTGFSNGGMMALKLQCETGLFAAAVSVAGPLLDSTCAHPTWLHLVGGADQIIPPAGGPPSVGGNWCTCSFPSSLTEPARFGPGVTLLYVPAANHTWPQADDGTWQLDGMVTAWTYLQPHRLQA